MAENHGEARIGVAPKPAVSVATLDGRAYYTITSFLKSIGVEFQTITPSEATNEGHKLTITTRKEKNSIRQANVLCFEDLGEDPVIMKEKIFIHFDSSNRKPLTIGIDPGKRIGMIAYIHGREIESEVARSPEEVIERVVKLVQNSPTRGVVKIGDGSPKLAEKMASEMAKRLGGRVDIELVDEKGTSSLASSRPHTKSTRDQRAARIIAHRPGRKYVLPFGS